MPNKKEDYWFKAKRYGYGWGMPVRREGWVTLGIFFVAYLSPLIWISAQAEERQDRYTLLYVVWAIVCVTALMIVVRRHGPAPSWSWGDKASDKKPKKK